MCTLTVPYTDFSHSVMNDIRAAVKKKLIILHEYRMGRKTSCNYFQGSGL